MFFGMRSLLHQRLFSTGRKYIESYYLAATPRRMPFNKASAVMSDMMIVSGAQSCSTHVHRLLDSTGGKLVYSLFACDLGEDMYSLFPVRSQRVAAHRKLPFAPRPDLSQENGFAQKKSQRKRVRAKERTKEKRDQPPSTPPRMP